MPDLRDDETWAGYYRWNQGRAPRPLLLRALTEYGEVRAGASALDLGCGAGVETRTLLDAGFAVTAVDSSDASIGIVSGYPEHGDRLRTLHGPMQDLTLPGVDLLYAGYALPFCPPDRFGGFWAAVVDAVRPGGLLAVDLFGDRDEWAASEPTMSFLTREQVLGLLEPLEVLVLDEVDEEGRAYAGPKHWHRFEVVARRRRPVVTR